MKFKIVFIVFCIVYSIIDIQAQRRRKSIPQTFLKFQSSIFYKFDSGYESIGFNKFNIGLVNHTPKKYVEYSLEAARFTDIPEFRIFSKENYFFEGSYFRSLKSIDKKHSSLFLGAFGSINFIYDKVIPSVSTSFTEKRICYCISVGPQLVYLINLNNKIKINLSTKINVLDFGFRRYKTNNPNIPLRTQGKNQFQFDFLRDVISINIGFNFGVG